VTNPGTEDIMDTGNQTSKQYFTALQIIYIALIAGQVFFGLIALFLNKTVGPFSDNLQVRTVLIYIVPVFIIIGFLGGKYLFRKKMDEVKNKSSLFEKMNEYRAALILRYAFLEGPTFLSIIAYLLTSSWYFLVIAGFIILIFLTMRPTGDRAADDLELNENERQIISNPDAVI